MSRASPISRIVGGYPASSIWRAMKRRTSSCRSVSPFMAFPPPEHQYTVSMFRRQESVRPLASLGMPPSLFAALRLGLRAVSREPWLLAVALLVALVRRAAVWPAWAVGWAVLARSAVIAATRRPLDPLAPVEGLLATVTAPRFLALVAGLWLAGIAVGALLRIAYVSGALPTLGAAMAGAEGPRFASGIAFGFPRVLAAAALALTLAVAVPSTLSPVADAAVARAAVYGEGPGEAFAEAGARLLARPGTFVVAGLAFGAAGLLAPGLVAGLGSAATGFGYANPLVLVGPNLMVATASAAAVDVVWLGTVAALACGNVTRG